MDADLAVAGSHDNRTFIVLQRGSQTRVRSGLWKLQIMPEEVHDGSWHAWIQRTSVGGAAFEPPFVSMASTISM